MKTKTFTIKDIEDAVSKLNEGKRFECSATQLLLYLKSKYRKKKQ